MHSTIIVCVLLLVPTDAPKIVELFNTSSTSLLLRWDHWRPYFGDDASYEYLIKRTDYNNVTKEISVKAEEQENELTGLSKHRQYCLTVKTILKVGAYGDESDRICAFTAEDGKNGFTEIINHGSDILNRNDNVQLLKT